MTGKSIIVEYDEFMNWFVPAPSGVKEPTARLKALNFTKVATKPESNMYRPLMAALNKDWLLPKDNAISNAYAADPNEKSKQVVDAGIYRRSDAPSVGKKTGWGYMELSIECKTEDVQQDPFDEKNPSGSHQPRSDIRKEVLGQIMCYSVLVFDHQRRVHHFTLIIFGKNARLVRWDRSGVVATRAFDYVAKPEMLGRFIWRFGRMSPEQRGHDPTATRISPDSDQFRLMMERAMPPTADDASEEEENVDEEPDLNNEGEGAGDEGEDPDDADPMPELAELETEDSSDWETDDSAEEATDGLDDEAYATDTDDGTDGTGIPGDHARAGFAESIKGGAICWRLQVDDAQKGAQYFLVGKPHFIAAGLAGRGTQTFIAIDEADPQGPFVYLKDAWRVAHIGIEQEGKILERLNSNDDGGPVPFVPTMRCHGDVQNQVTRSQEIWHLKNPGKLEECPLKTHRHYRLVVNEVGIPMSKFTNMQELVALFSMVIETHGEAYNRKKLIHRDISAGNVLIYPKVTVGENGELEEDRVPLLADWELAKRVDEPDEKARQPDRTFMSANALRHPHKRILVQDDMESLFHLLLYYAVRFLPHNWSDVGRFMDVYFDGHEDQDGVTYGGEKKLVTMRMGKLSAPVGDLPLRIYVLPAKRRSKQKTSPPASANEAQPSTSRSSSSHAGCDAISSPASSKPSAPQKEKPPHTLPTRPHPVNELFSDFLQRLSAYYTLYVPEDTDLPSERASKALRPMKKRPRPPNESRKTLHARMEALKEEAESKHPSADSPSKQLSPARRSELEVLAASLADHVKLAKLFTAHYWRSGWPIRDRCPDQLPADYRPKNERGLAMDGTGTKRSADSTFEVSDRCGRGPGAN
ncbi:hypothetical protein GY45DRAFT_376152 [Cubamyces sp. BRFM 1775]|nr:hypothetical protein GY45DRAFT_376152 [Cubamyces sp. BRFM 1775]